MGGGAAGFAGVTVIRMYVDSGVLIAAVRGRPDLAARCLALLVDPGRVFLSSAFVRLELLPKAAYHRQEREVVFLEAFFRRVSEWADVDPLLIAEAEAVARTHGLNALDALHVAAAARLKVDELVTTEGVSKPMHRVRGFRVGSV